MHSKKLCFFQCPYTPVFNAIFNFFVLTLNHEVSVRGHPWTGRVAGGHTRIVAVVLLSVQLHVGPLVHAPLQHRLHTLQVTEDASGGAKVSGEARGKDKVSEFTMSEDRLGEGPRYEDRVSEDTSGADRVSKDPRSEESVREDASGNDSVSKDTRSEDRGREETSCGDRVSMDK